MSSPLTLSVPAGSPFVRLKKLPLMAAIALFRLAIASTVSMPSTPPFAIVSVRRTPRASSFRKYIAIGPLLSTSERSVDVKYWMPGAIGSGALSQALWAGARRTSARQRPRVIATRARIGRFYVVCTPLLLERHADDLGGVEDLVHNVEARAALARWRRVDLRKHRVVVIQPWLRDEVEEDLPVARVARSEE